MLFTKLSEKVHEIYTFIDFIIQISEIRFRDIHHGAFPFIWSINSWNAKMVK